jgi:hypothetical protein
MKAHTEQAPRTKQTSRRNPNNLNAHHLPLLPTQVPSLPMPAPIPAQVQPANSPETKTDPQGHITIAAPSPTLTCAQCFCISSLQYNMIKCVQCESSNFVWACKCVEDQTSEQPQLHRSRAQSEASSDSEDAGQPAPSTFFNDWPYVNKVKAELNADSVEVIEKGDYFSTGRKKYLAIFFSLPSAGEKQEISRHLAMRLVNKVGAPYMVCQRKSFEDESQSRARMRSDKPSRSYTQQIYFIAPGKAGVIYHHQECNKKPQGCVKASIEFAYAMRMKAAPCCGSM